METNVPSYPFEKISMENQNEIMSDALESLNVSYTTSPLITPRLMQRWNVYIAFWVTYWPNYLKENKNWIKFYLLSEHDLVLLIDNFLKLRSKYVGEKWHKILVVQQQNLSAGKK